MREVNGDDSVRVVILTGAGRAFCAGADLTETVSRDEHFRVEDQLNGEYSPSWRDSRHTAKPWISSAVSRAAAGIGSAFAMVCDLRRHGKMPTSTRPCRHQPGSDGGATWHRCATIGAQAGLPRSSYRERDQGAALSGVGFCSQVVPAGQLMEHTWPGPKSWLARHRWHCATSKQVSSTGAWKTTLYAISGEARLNTWRITSDDAQEGVQAFMEKRAPSWRSR